MQGLARVSRHGSGDSTKDGMRGVAWNLLMRHHSEERDMRVLEALKLAKVCSVTENRKGWMGLRKTSEWIHLYFRVGLHVIQKVLE